MPEISLLGATGFNSGSINLFITICDYDEEKYDDDDDDDDEKKRNSTAFSMRSALRASRVITFIYPRQCLYHKF